MSIFLKYFYVTYLALIPGAGLLAYYFSDRLELPVQEDTSLFWFMMIGAFVIMVYSFAGGYQRNWPETIKHQMTVTIRSIISILFLWLLSGNIWLALLNAFIIEFCAVQLSFVLRVKSEKILFWIWFLVICGGPISLLVYNTYLIEDGLTLVFLFQLTVSAVSTISGAKMMPQNSRMPTAGFAVYMFLISLLGYMLSLVFVAMKN